MNKVSKIYNVVPNIGEESSGPSYSVVGHVNSIRKNLGYLILISLGDEKNNGFKKHVRYIYFSCTMGFARFGLSFKMFLYFLKQPRNEISIVHLHSMWMWPVIFPAYLKLFKGFKLIVSPRGSLSPWAMRNGHLVKKIVWFILQKKVIKNADIIHVTSTQERDEVRGLGFLNKVVIIPNGIEVLDAKYKLKNGSRIVLFLGRIHKKKGLDILLRGWKDVSERFPDWKLKIVGPDDGYAEQVKKLIFMHSLQNVILCAEQIGENKYYTYGEAEIFVLPTYSENFGMTVAESLMIGTPVVVSKGAPWSDVEKHNCGRWVDISVQSVSKGLIELMGMSVLERIEMGLRGRDWMIREFSWENQGSKFDLVYEGLLSGQFSKDLFIDKI